ncbi:MAG: hypothetical protein M3Z46_02560 [Actinomycetota bacterium]|nr:hypothetical protein [Actinomycetota bacterium]
MAAAVGVVVLGASVHLAGGVGVVLGIAPAEGPPGAPYRVTVQCDQTPRLYGRPLTDDDPPGTILPLELGIAQSAPGSWTYDAVAGRYDELYGAVCGESVAQSRFDADAPRLYLGPVPTVPFSGAKRTRVEGTDCPTGTTAQVTITIDGRSQTHTAAIDQLGDWAVDLPAPVGTKEMSVDASCGSVAYSRLVIASTTTTTTTTTTTPTSPTTSTTPPTSVIPDVTAGTASTDAPPTVSGSGRPAPPAVPASPSLGPPQFTG